MKTKLNSILRGITGLLALFTLAASSAMADDSGRDTLILTSTNSAAGNDIVVFKLSSAGNALSLVTMLPTGGNGGAGGNAGSVQFSGEFGAVSNYGSNSITQLVRSGDSVNIGRSINLSPGCTGPLSVALAKSRLYAVGANCVESHSWPDGHVSGPVIGLADSSAGQIAVGQTWAAVTLKSGSLLQLPLDAKGALTGAATPVTLPSDANNTPLGAAFWGDLLGFNPAHSPDSFTLVDRNRDVFPVAGPQPSYPTNAPCWLVKGPGNVWYSGNSPGSAVSIFFSDGQGGEFYKSIPLPGNPFDITVSPDGNWLAVIYTASDSSGGRIAVFSIDAFGDLTMAATSGSVGVASFNGVAFSQ